MAVYRHQAFPAPEAVNPLGFIVFLAGGTAANPSESHFYYTPDAPADLRFKNFSLRCRNVPQSAANQFGA
jgi:hypothetical protein